MHTIAQIQNKKLKEFLSEYDHFQDLSAEEQQKYLEKILVMDDAKQYEVYEFLYQENEKEKLKMLKALSEKLAEFSKIIKKIKTQEKEASSENKDSMEMDELMKEIETA